MGMERGTRAVEVVVALAVGGAVVAVAIGIYVSTAPSGDGRPWFLGGGLSFAFAVLLTLFYFEFTRCWFTSTVGVSRSS